MSDEHFSVIPIRKAIDIVNGLDADLVVLTGDFVTVPLFKKYLGGRKRAARFIEPCVNLLAQVHGRRGVLAILGNHDAGSDPHRISEALQAKGITVLRNRPIPFEQSTPDQIAVRAHHRVQLNQSRLPPSRSFYSPMSRILPMPSRIIRWIFNCRAIPNLDFVRGEPGDPARKWSVWRSQRAAQRLLGKLQPRLSRLCRSHSCLLLSNEAEAGVSPLRK